MTLTEIDCFDDFFMVRHEKDSDEYTMHADPDTFHGCDGGWDLLGYHLDNLSDVDCWFECEKCHESFKVNYQFTDTIGVDE